MSLKLFYKKYNLEIILTGIALLASVLSTIYFMRQHTSLADGDAVAHLNIARRVIDSLTPGFAQLGYVWLPINHLLMLPFIWINSLYYSGLAGIIVSEACFVCAALYIYKTAALLGNSKLAGVCAFIFFVANPNMLYMQATPLTEPFYVFSLTAGIYYLLLWAKEHKLRSLVLGSVFLLASNLSRYDGWFISFFVLLALAAYEFWTSRNWKKTEAIAILFGALAFLGPLLWLVWNLAIFGNPIYFLIGQYSAKAQQMDLLKHGQLPSYLNIGNASLTIFYSGQMVIGWSVLIMGCFGLLYLIWAIIREKKYYQILFFLLGLQVVYYILNIYFANGVVFVPQLPPYKMFNIRYALTFIPFLVIAAGVAVSRLKWVAALAVAVVLLEYSAVAAHGNIITLNEAVNGYAGKTANASRIAAGEWLSKNYNGGLILGDVFVNDASAFYSGISEKDWVTNGNVAAYEKAVSNPATIVDWVLVRNGDGMAQIFTPSDLSADGFGVAYQQQDITIYEKGRSPAAISSTGTHLPVSHLVVKGESLWSIAQTYLNNGYLWTKIASDNNLSDPGLIYPGNVIIIAK